MNGDVSDTSFLRQALAQAVEQGASDLHCVVGHQPTMRVHGRLQPARGPVLTAELARAALLALCPPQALEQFEREHNADFALELDLGGARRRLRVNYFLSSFSLGACFRIIPSDIPDFAWAGFPLTLAQRLIHFRNGLVLISGVSGAGKTTTLAMLINLLAQEGDYRIITLEEPIEYVFPSSATSIVTQREVGRDVPSFAEGLKYGLRQDPDIILVGEIRDHETAQMALSAAETGHLVFATLHTRDAKGAITRYVDLVPQHVQGEIRAQLAFSLRAVICQHLLPSVAGESASSRSRSCSTIRRSPAPFAPRRTRASTATYSRAARRECCRSTNRCGSFLLQARSAVKRRSNSCPTKVHSVESEPRFPGLSLRYDQIQRRG